MKAGPWFALVLLVPWHVTLEIIPKCMVNGATRWDGGCSGEEGLGASVMTAAEVAQDRGIPGI